MIVFVQKQCWRQK